MQNGLGIWQIINSNIVTDIIAKSNFDLTLLDLEHGLHSPQSIQDCIFAAKSNPYPASNPTARGNLKPTVGLTPSACLTRQINEFISKSGLSI